MPVILVLLKLILENGYWKSSVEVVVLVLNVFNQLPASLVLIQVLPMKINQQEHQRAGKKQTRLSRETIKSFAQNSKITSATIWNVGVQSSSHRTGLLTKNKITTEARSINKKHKKLL